MARRTSLDPEWLDTYEAAEFLGLARGTLANWRLEGRGPEFRRFGKGIRYRKADLQAWAEGHPVEHYAAPHPSSPQRQPTAEAEEAKEIQRLRGLLEEREAEARQLQAQLDTMLQKLKEARRLQATLQREHDTVLQNAASQEHEHELLRKDLKTSRKALQKAEPVLQWAEAVSHMQLATLAKMRDRTICQITFTLDELRLDANGKQLIVEIEGEIHWIPGTLRQFDSNLEKYFKTS